MKPTLSRPLHVRQRGFSLIEILVAVVVLSIGLLGLAGLQTTSLRINQSAYMQTQAVSRAYDVIDQVRADLPNWASYHNQNFDLSASIPNGNALTEVDNSMLIVTVSWDDRAAGGSDAATVVVETMMVAQ